MAYITCRLAAGVDYVFYAQGPNGINAVKETISIEGGSDVINKRNLITPDGMVTEIADDKLEKLKTHPVFQEHLRNGFIKICDTAKSAEKSGVELDKDNSRQLTPKDYNDEGKKAPKTKRRGN